MRGKSDDFEPTSRETFAANAQMSLQEIRSLVAQKSSGISRRDTLSALDSVARLFERDLLAIRATPRTVRDVFSSKTAAQLGVSEKRYANVRSCVAGAIRTFGEAPVPITKRISLTREWRALLDTIENRNHRYALYRLSAYCSHMRITPTSVGHETLLGFFQALEAEEVVKNPRRLLKHTIAHWNMCGRRIGSWPPVRLASPFKQEIISLPLRQFPKSFQRDLECWEQRLLAADPLDLEGPARPLKQISIEGQKRIIVRFASALISSGISPNKIEKLRFLVALPNYKAGLRFFLNRFDNKPTSYIGKIARGLFYVAKHYCRLKPKALTELDLVCRRLNAGRSQQMTARNRERLSQFDDPDNVAKLLSFPQQERSRGLVQKNPYRAAKCFERALATAILISCCLRIQNLRTIDLSTDVRWVSGKCFISIDGSKVKNRQSLAFELPDDVAALLKEFIRDYRTRLPGSSGPYLFPGRDGGPRPHSTMRTDFQHALRKRAGLIVNPHLMRHSIAKIVIERDPGMAVAISQLLGHKRLDMTMAHYLGTEGRVAGRRIDRLLQQARQHSVDRGAEA